MGLAKAGATVGKKIIAWASTGGDSLLAIRPIKINTCGLKYVPKLENDVVQLSGKKLAQIKAEADEILKKLKVDCGVEYTEKNFPEVVENVKQGNIRLAEEVSYYQYKILESLAKECPETFVLLGKHKGSPLYLRIMVQKYGNTPLKIAKEVPTKQIEQTFAQVDDFAAKLEEPFEPEFCHYINALVMKKYNPKTYKHIMTTSDDEIPYIFKQWGDNWQDCPTVRMLSNITPGQMHTMAYDRMPLVRNVGQYVEDSDVFVRNSKLVQEMSEDLSKVKLSSDVKLYRGEKTVGIFDTVGIDKDFERQIRQLLEKNKNTAQNLRVTTYSPRYKIEPSTNLYDFISSKETLTLADAMQVAKFGDEKFITEVAGRIQKAKITDTRFKSYSFDEGMARGWRGTQNCDNTTIIQNATVKKGTQGGFHDGDNAQYEVVLNNTPKEISCNKVVYNKETDTFELDTIVQNI